MADLQYKIQSFFASKSKSIPEFEGRVGFCEFVILVDITSHLNDVNTRLQEKDQLINKMHDLIFILQTKLDLWEQLRINNFSLLPTLQLQPDVSGAADKYTSLISDFNL